MNNSKRARDQQIVLAPERAQYETYLRYEPEEVVRSYPPKQGGVSLRQYIGALLRSYKSILAWSVVTAGLALGIAALQNQTFTSNTTIKIETDHTRILSYDLDTNKPASYVNDAVFYNTQYKLLRSRDLAARVIDELNIRGYLLAEKPFKPVVYEAKSSITAIGTYIKSFLPQNAKEVGEEVTAEDIFLKNLQVKPVKNSRVIDITYTTQDPRLARDVLDALNRHFIAMQYDARQDSAKRAKEYLEDQTVVARNKLQDSEAALIKYARDKAIVDTETDKSILANNLESLSRAYMQAKENRIKAENQYLTKRDISAELNTSDSALIQERKLERNRLQAEYNSKLAMFKPAYPEMQELKKKIDELSYFINSESGKINKHTVTNMKANYETALNDEFRLGQEIKKLEQSLLNNRDNSIGYGSLKREVDTSRQLYEGLLQRLKEISVAAPVQADNVTIVDSPIVPLQKDGPKYALYLALGALLGLLMGSLRSFWRETIRPKIRNVADLNWLAKDCGIIASVPHVRGARTFKLATLAINNPDSKLAEAVRSLKASLSLGHEGKLPKVLHLTSCHPGEGKSTIAVNLASSLAQAGKRVLLVDADLRRPAVHKYLRLNNEIGLANYLTGERVIPQKLEGFERFMVMCAGPALHDPVGALDSKQLDELLHKARLVFDHVIIDAPPVLGMADSLVLANKADGTLLVVADERSTQPEIDEVVRLIQGSQGQIVGVVHNMSKQKSTHTYSQRGYSDGRKVLNTKSLAPQF